MLDCVASLDQGEVALDMFDELGVQSNADGSLHIVTLLDTYNECRMLHKGGYPNRR